MNFLSYIMPKLAWIIPLVVLVFVIYVLIQNLLSSNQDKKTKANGVDIDAMIVEVKYDRDQRINNHLSATLTIKFDYNGENVVGSRGMIFPTSCKEDVISGKVIRVRVNKDKPDNFYFIDFRNV